MVKLRDSKQHHCRHVFGYVARPKQFRAVFQLVRRSILDGWSGGLDFQADFHIHGSGEDQDNHRKRRGV